MIAQYILKRWFEEQLNFTLRDGTAEESVLIGTSEFTPVEILNEFSATYQQDLTSGLRIGNSDTTTTVRHCLVIRPMLIATSTCKMQLAGNRLSL